MREVCNVKWPLDRIGSDEQYEYRGPDHGSVGRHRHVEQAKVPRDPNPDGSRIRGGTRHARRRNAGYLRLWRSRETRPSMIFRPDDQGRGWIHASDFETVFAIRSPRVRKRSSTFSPVFAEL